MVARKERIRVLEGVANFICHNSAFVGLQRILFFLEVVKSGILPVNL